jgi:NAD+ kinase
MLEATVNRENRELFRLSCLNDIVISASGNAKMIRLQVFSHVRESVMRLGQYRSDGLIIATPTGSTAYSVAAGGPVMDPELETVIINPICPFTLSNRPIVLPSKETLIVEVEQEQRSGVLLSVDGQVTEPLEPGDRVYISPSSRHAILIASDRCAFYQALRRKLSWLELPGEAFSANENDGAFHA